MEAEKDVLSADTLAAIRWLGMPEGTPFPLTKTNHPSPRPETLAAVEMMPGEVRRLDDVPSHDPSAWSQDFDTWAMANCVFRDRSFGGIGTLHTAFCEWAIAHESVPCQRETFERLLRLTSFELVDGLVHGLLLKEDWESAWCQKTLDSLNEQ